MGVQLPPPSCSSSSAAHLDRHGRRQAHDNDGRRGEGAPCSPCPPCRSPWRQPPLNGQLVGAELHDRDRPDELAAQRRLCEDEDVSRGEADGEYARAAREVERDHPRGQGRVGDGLPRRAAALLGVLAPQEDLARLRARGEEALVRGEGDGGEPLMLGNVAARGHHGHRVVLVLRRGGERMLSRTPPCLTQ